jgi:CRISPR/Cas system CSM-associated protein Csm3 (group 7 of RAMP superfamily)
MVKVAKTVMISIVRLFSILSNYTIFSLEKRKMREKRRTVMAQIEQIEIKYDLTFTTPFHCGTGLRVGLIDRTIVRDHGGYLYVPGSTIKGVLREQCERLARLFEFMEQDSIISPHDTEKALWAQGHPDTMITRIFGSSLTPGLLFFDDARQDDNAKRAYDSRDRRGRDDWRGKYKRVQIDLSTQARIDRLTRTAARSALYTSEFGIKDLTFKGSISGWLKCTAIEGVENGPTYSLLLLLTSLHLLSRIGGNKSTGKGQCRCIITALKRGETSYQKEQWQSWLNHLDALSDYSSSALLQEEDA